MGRKDQEDQYDSKTGVKIEDSKDDKKGITLKQFGSLVLTLFILFFGFRIFLYFVSLLQ